MTVCWLRTSNNQSNRWNKTCRVSGPGFAFSGTKGAQQQLQDPEQIAGPKESMCYRSWNCCWAPFVPLRARPGPRNLSAPGLETVVGHLSFHWGRTGPRNLCLQWNEKRRVRGPGLALSGTKGAQRQFQDPQQIQPCPQWNQKRRVRGPVALSGTKGGQQFHDV